jgi:hypothetical protein
MYASFVKVFYLNTKQEYGSSIKSPFGFPFNGEMRG